MKLSTIAFRYHGLDYNFKMTLSWWLCSMGLKQTHYISFVFIACRNFSDDMIHIGRMNVYCQSLYS